MDWSSTSSSLLTQAANTGLKVLNYVSAGFPNLGTVSQIGSLAAGQSQSKAVQAVVKSNQINVNPVGFNPITTAKTLTPDFLDGVLSDFFSPMDLSNSTGGSDLSGNNDASTATGGSNSVIPNLPFWVKTAIVCAVLLGTTLIVKGSLEK